MRIKTFWIYSAPPPPPPVCFTPPVTNYMLLYGTLLCKKIARAPGGRTKYKLTKLGGRTRIDPNFYLKAKVPDQKKKIRNIMS